MLTSSNIVEQQHSVYGALLRFHLSWGRVTQDVKDLAVVQVSIPFP